MVKTISHKKNTCMYTYMNTYVPTSMHTSINAMQTVSPGLAAEYNVTFHQNENNQDLLNCNTPKLA